jgi:hypothetical protein
MSEANTHTRGYNSYRNNHKTTLTRTYSERECIRCKPPYWWKLWKLRSGMHDPNLMARERGGEYLHFSARQLPFCKSPHPPHPHAPPLPPPPASHLPPPHDSFTAGTPGILARPTPLNAHRSPLSMAAKSFAGLGSSSQTSHAESSATPRRMAHWCLGGCLAGA